jgi:uncharacterized protein (DUF302 family)
MNYYFSKTLYTSFDDAMRLVTEALKAEGFGVISEIRMHEKLKEKLGVEFKKYTILGTCNPEFAYKALLIEDKIGTMLPCNILVIEQEQDKIEVAAVNPIASMSAIANTELINVSRQVTDMLKRLIENL